MATSKPRTKRSPEPQSSSNRDQGAIPGIQRGRVRSDVPLLRGARLTFGFACAYRRLALLSTQ